MPLPLINLVGNTAHDCDIGIFFRCCIIPLLIDSAVVNGQSVTGTFVDPGCNSRID